MKQFYLFAVPLLIALPLLSVAAEEQAKEQKKEILGTIERRDPRFDKLVPKDAQLEKIADGFQFTEGAVWSKAGNFLLFSDIPSNAVMKWQEGKGTSEFLKPSGYTGTKARTGKGEMAGSNGLAFDAEGRMCLCEHGDRRVTRIKKDGKKTVLADKFDGKRLNSPNDLVIHPNGDVYFTDPNYGLPKGEKSDVGFTGIYRISAKDSKVSLISKDHQQPNGIALSPDAKLLYVTNGNVWTVYPLNADGSVGAGKVFSDPKKWMPAVKGNAILDGMKVDAQGNVFATGPGGICVMAPDGTLLGIFRTGEQTANCCFGDADGQTLFVCANRKIGRVRLTTKGIGW